MPKKPKDPLKNILVSIDTTLQKQNSLRQVFIQGLMRGFGTALGATVLLAIVTSITFQFIDIVDPQTFSQYFFNDVFSE